ncbi:MAG TPA: PKD domain-containing protein [Solirubrobacterales bacterium]|nr:PKD domain-containing protein [Solirubrobacterales bacterium]
MDVRRRGKIAAALLAAVLSTALFAQSASAGTLYTTNYSDRQIAVLSIGPGGLLAPLTGSPFPIAHFDYGLGITPDGRVLISPSGFDGFMETFNLAADGTPSLASPPAPAAIFGGQPAITPDGRFFYVLAEPKGVAGYIIGTGGAATPLGTPVGVGSGPVAITPDGRFLFMVDYPNGNLERFAIGADGSLAPLPIVPLGLDQGSDEMRITPDGRLAILLSRHIAAKEDLRTLTIGADGSVTPTGTVLKTTGETSGMLVISPNGRFAYVANGNEASVSAYAIGPAGQLTPLGDTPTPALSQPQSLAMSVDGRFLYAEPQSGEKIQALSVAADGSLTVLGAPTPTGGESDAQTPVARPSDPVASFAATAGPPHGPTSFDASASTDTTSKIVSYEWNFGDGTTQTTATPTTTHNYKDPGVYTASLSLVDANGCSGYSYTGQIAYCGGRDASRQVDTLPAIYSITATPAKFATSSRARPKSGKRKKAGTTLHYKLSEAANVFFTVQRKLPGRRVGRSCKKPTKANTRKRRCTRLGNVLSSFGAAGKAGRNSKRFLARTRRGPLKPGAYLITAVATDRAGGVSAPRTVGIKVKKKAPVKH